MLLGGRAVDEGESVDIAQIEGEHSEDHARERRAEDLRLGVKGAAEEVLLAEKPDTDPVLDPAAAALPLIGAASRYRPDGKAGRPRAGIVLSDPGQSRVDHKTDVRNGDRGFRHIGCNDDLPCRRRSEDTLLLRCGKPREEGKDGSPFPETSGEKAAGFPDVLFRRHEDQDIAPFTPFHEIFNRPNGRLDGRDFPLFFQFGVEGFITDLDGIEPPGDLDDRRVAESPRELLRIDGCRGDDDVKVLPSLKEGFQNTEDEIDIEAPLVGLVDNDRVVGAKQRIVMGFHEQDPVGHNLQEGIVRGPVVEADLVTDRPADLFPHLFGDPAGDGSRRDPPRLGTADQPCEPSTGFQAHLRDLGGLPGAGLPGDDDDGMPPDGSDDITLSLQDRQGWRIDNPREMGAARFTFFYYTIGSGQWITFSSYRHEDQPAG